MVICLTETWLTADVRDDELPPTDSYNIYRKDRDGHGGVLTAVHTSINSKHRPDWVSDNDSHNEIIAYMYIVIFARGYKSIPVHVYGCLCVPTLWCGPRLIISHTYGCVTLSPAFHIIHAYVFIWGLRGAAVSGRDGYLFPTLFCGIRLPIHV